MLKFEFEECCPYCDHTLLYSIEDVGTSGFITCKNCGKKYLACSICTHAVDGNGNCSGCGHGKTKWALSIPDTEYVLDELIKSVNNVASMRVANVRSAEDKAEKSIESCMQQIQDYVHEYMRPYISLLCMENERIQLTVVTEPYDMPNLYIQVCCSGDTCLWSLDKSVHWKIVSNWKSVKEDIHDCIQDKVKHILRDLKEREDKAMNTQRIADTFEV